MQGCSLQPGTPAHQRVVGGWIPSSWGPPLTNEEPFPTMAAAGPMTSSRGTQSVHIYRHGDGDGPLTGINTYLAHPTWAPVSWQGAGVTTAKGAECRPGTGCTPPLPSGAAWLAAPERSRTLCAGEKTGPGRERSRQGVGAACAPPILPSVGFPSELSCQEDGTAGLTTVSGQQHFLPQPRWPCSQRPCFPGGEAQAEVRDSLKVEALGFETRASSPPHPHNWSQTEGPWPPRRPGEL